MSRFVFRSLVIAILASLGFWFGSKLDRYESNAEALRTAGPGDLIVMENGLTEFVMSRKGEVRPDPNIIRTMELSGRHLHVRNIDELARADTKVLTRGTPEWKDKLASFGHAVEIPIDFESPPYF